MYFIKCFYFCQQNALEVDFGNWEKVKNAIHSKYNEFKSLKDPLCVDDSYHDRIDIISKRWILVLNKFQNYLSKFKVSY